MDVASVALVQQQEEVQDARPPSETKETPSILNKRTLELGEESSGEEEIDEKVRLTKWNFKGRPLCYGSDYFEFLVGVIICYHPLSSV